MAKIKWEKHPSDTNFVVLNQFWEYLYKDLSYVDQSKMLPLQRWWSTLGTGSVLFDDSVGDFKFKVLKWKVRMLTPLLYRCQPLRFTETWHDTAQVKLSDKVTCTWHQNWDNAFWCGLSALPTSLASFKAVFFQPSLYESPSSVLGQQQRFIVRFKCRPLGLE